jgi:hypothetical protein
MYSNNNRGRRIKRAISKLEKSMKESNPPELENQRGFFSSTLNKSSLGLNTKYGERMGPILKTNYNCVENVRCNGHKISSRNISGVYLRLKINGLDQWMMFGDVISEKHFTSEEVEAITCSIERTLIPSLYREAMSSFWG